MFFDILYTILSLSVFRLITDDVKLLSFIGFINGVFMIHNIQRAKRCNDLTMRFIHIAVNVLTLSLLSIHFGYLLKHVYLIPQIYQSIFLVVDLKLNQRMMTIDFIEKELEKRQNAKKQD